MDSKQTQHKIRLEAIDAPESHQSFGTQSKKALSDKVFGKVVRVEWEKNDKYRRTLGHVFVDDRWINKELIAEGWAWHYKQFSKDEDLASAETVAKKNKAGLWVDSKAIAPWDFRHNPELADSTDASNVPASGESIVYVTKTGKSYHRDGCRYLSKSKTPIALKDVHGKYSKCSVCNPAVFTPPTTTQQPATATTERQSSNEATREVQPTTKPSTADQSSK